LCLNLHGGTRSAWLTALSGAPLRAGFAHFQFPNVYNLRIPRAQQILGCERKVHTAEHVASAVFWLGVPAAPIPRARLFASGAGRIPNAAVIHPAASTPDKTWPADRFLAAARHLRRSGLEPVFIGGPGDDLAPFAEFQTLAGAPLAQVKSVIAGAALFLGNDSGPAHIAAAFGVPVVALFGPSDPVIWAPWQTPSAVLSGSQGIGSIAVPEVLDALERLRMAA
jgi:ADP-heptose:LPS heptosyltransferase